MRARLEIAAAVLSAVVHFLATVVLGWRGVDLAVIGGGWIAYAAWRARTPGVLASWGLRREGFRPCAREAAIVLVVGVALCATMGGGRAPLAFDGSLAMLLVLYPLWGLVQQTIVLGIVAGNLLAFGVPVPLVVVVAALGFAAVHVPDGPLCWATLALGAVAGVLFVRWRNLWPLALLHGWLGALFYRWVLARDPWAELTGGAQ